MLIFVVLLLVAAGLVILYSTSAYNGQVKFHDPFHYLKKQGFATLLGLFGMALIARVDYHKWVPLAIPAYVTSIILSVAVIFFGVFVSCFTNQFHIGTSQFLFQL